MAGPGAVTRRPASEELRAKLSAASKRRWAKHHEAHPKLEPDPNRKRRRGNRHCIRRTHGIGG